MGFQTDSRICEGIKKHEVVLIQSVQFRAFCSFFFFGEILQVALGLDSSSIQIE
jgi:hypothetical protein